jgi:cobalt-zinc-cadmium efflux system outer membrane protein
MHAVFRRAPACMLVVAAATACAGGGAHYQSLREEFARTSGPPAAPAPATAESDALFRGMESLDREALVRAVLQRNPTLRSAAAAWRAALARYPQETSLADPMLGMGLGPRSFAASEVRDAWRADISQELPFPGKLALRGEVALAEADAAGGDFEAARLQLATMTSLLYDDYYLAARTLEVEQHHVTLLEELERSATARLEAGQASLVDPIQATAELGHRRHDRVRYETALRTTAQQLNLLLQRAPELALPPPPRELTPPPLPEGLETGAEPNALVSQALSVRPELRAARGRVTSGEAAVSLAEREYFPNFTVSAAYDAFWQERPLQPSVGLQLNIPLRRERRAAAVEEAEAKLARARSDEAAASAEVRFSVANALERLHEARHVLHLQEQELVPAAREFVEAARIGFETGGGSFQTLIEAERGLRTAELDEETARTDVSRRMTELARALGHIPGLP